MAEARSAVLEPRATISLGDDSLSLAIGDDILGAVQRMLKRHLKAASEEREEEQKMWESSSGWDSSFWGGGSKRQGRRSPFRLMRKTSSGDLA